MLFEVRILIRTPTASDNAFWFSGHKAITIREMTAACYGGTNVNWTLYKGATLGSSTTTVHAANTTTAAEGNENQAPDTTPTVAADQWLNLDVNTVTGAVTAFSICLRFTID